MIHSLQLGNVAFEERQGGLARVFYELARHLPSAGVEVREMVIGSKQIEEKSNGRVTAFASTNQPMFQRFYAARKAMSKILATEQVDLVASHFALYAAPVLSQIRHLPLVVHFHGPWAAEGSVEGTAPIRSFIQASMESAVYKRASTLIVLSHAFKQELIERYDVSEGRIRVVPAGVDIDRFDCSLTRVQARERLGWPPDRPTILAVRRLVHRMGLEDLIDATKELAIKNTDVLVFLGGTGPLANDLQRRIDTQSLGNNVRLLGRISDEDLSLAYRAADVSIVPSTSLEGFGMITLESLACGTPVIVTPVGGLPEVVAQLAPELVLESTGAAAIGRGLGDVLRGAIHLPTDAECRAYVIANYTWPIVAQQISRVYMETLAKTA